MGELWTRRVVTARDTEGRSVVASDQTAQHHDFRSIPGMRETTFWHAMAGAPLDATGSDPVPGLDHDLPRPGEVMFRSVTFPPDAVFSGEGFDHEAASDEQARITPELAALFEPDAPGFHATQTIDYIFVLEGSIVLELDDGSVRLNRGDCVVQNATRHAWRNPTGEPAVLGVVSIGIL